MVSLPDELLRRIDAQARAQHSSRSGFLRRLAERELSEDDERRREQIAMLLGDPVRLGGDGVRLIRADRSR